MSSKFLKIFRDRKYFSWLLECPREEREKECRILKDTLNNLNVSYLDKLNSENNPFWIAPYFPSRKYPDIKYQLCVETFNYYFYQECRILSKNQAESKISKKDKENERFISSMSDEERLQNNISEIRYSQFDNMTLTEYKDFLFREYLHNPPSSIKLETGYSVTHISPNSILGVGILDENFFDTNTTNKVIKAFLSLEDDFLPILFSQELPSKRQRKKFYQNPVFPYKNYKEIQKDRVNPDWYKIH